MAGRVLLDTSAAAALLRGDHDVADKLRASAEAYTSSVVVGELLYGARHSTNVASNLEHVAAFAAAIVILPADQETAEVYARIKQGLRSKGRPIPDNDLWIAATAGNRIARACATSWSTTTSRSTSTSCGGRRR